MNLDMKVDEDLHEENEKPDPEEVENYECKNCEISFASYKILQMHEVMVHPVHQQIPYFRNATSFVFIIQLLYFSLLV